MLIVENIKFPLGPHINLVMRTFNFTWEINGEFHGILLASVLSKHLIIVRLFQTLAFMSTHVVNRKYFPLTARKDLKCTHANGVHLITDRIRRMGEGNVFSLFTPWGGIPRPGPNRGVPCQGLGRGVPQPGPDGGGGTPSRSQQGGYLARS